MESTPSQVYAYIFFFDVVPLVILSVRWEWVIDNNAGKREVDQHSPPSPDHRFFNYTDAFNTVSLTPPA